MTIQRGSSIRLDSMGALRSAPLWQHVASAGRFDGYHGGAFIFDRAVFDNVVQRFRQSPAYRVGPDGVGSAPVVPWDVAHLSESAASNPAAHAAVGWATDLDVRDGADGEPELWARTIWTEPMRQQVLGGAFRFASVVVDFGAVDARTAAPLGPVLSSIAATNSPFIQNLLPLIAASRVPVSAPRVAAARIGIDVSANSPAARRLAASLTRSSAATAAGDDTGPAPAVAIVDARQATGRNATERAITAMRQHSTAFGRLNFDEQLSRACEAIRLGAVRV